ncbi:hypothetical protein [Pontibaca methylaminivorans]|uniref:hypothetical protein n=1 Tax=Pontibaca methylaminivorans TaxID=515897 RepID=UPI002FDA5FB0
MAEMFLLAGLSLAIVLRLLAGRARRDAGLPPAVRQAQAQAPGQAGAGKRPAVGAGRGPDDS